MSTIVRPASEALSAPSGPIDRLVGRGVRLLPLGLVGVSAVATTYVALTHGFATDIEIPLRAAERWLGGMVVYDPAAFDARGADLPFLYPPITLPFLAPLTVLPRTAVHVAWLALCLGAGLVAVRRLGLPRSVWPLAMLWPPFSEAIVGGNVQVLLFAGFCLVFWPPGAAATRRPLPDGVLTTLVGAMKVSQFQPWLALLRHRPVAAVLGAATVALIAALTLPLVGADLWVDWLGQAGRAGDPAWPYAGEPLSKIVGRPIGLAITVATAIAAVALPRRQAAVWIGILVVLGAPSLHIYGFLFLLPAMLVVRRDVGMLVAVLIASYQYVLIWTAVGVLVAALIRQRRRGASRVDR